MIDSSLKISRKLEIECFECIATVRKKGTRPDVEAILGLLKEYGSVTPEIILDHMLPRKPKAMANNLISRYQSLGFLDEEGRPGTYAQFGFEGEILLPERGKFNICSSPDPVLLQHIVGISYPPAQQNSRNRENRLKPVSIPDQIFEVVGAKCSVWFEGRKNIFLESIEKMGIPLNEVGEVFLEVLLDSNSTRIQISASGEKEKITLVESPPIDLELVWNHVLEAAELSAWHGGPLNLGQMRVSFADTTRQERESFTRKIESPPITVKGLGKFLVGAFSVSIAPRTREDATRWAKFLLLSQINDYISDQKYLEISHDIAGKFEAHKPDIPGRDKLIDSVQDYFSDSPDEAARKRWYIKAPMDLTEVN